MARAQVIGPSGFLPWRLYSFDVDLARVLDLCDDAVRRALDLSASDLTDDERSVPREIGVIAHGLSFQAIRSPSATGVDDVLAVFPDNIGAGKLQPLLAEEWTSLAQLSL
jgi:hypothetical protein